MRQCRWGSHFSVYFYFMLIGWARQEETEAAKQHFTAGNKARNLKWNWESSCSYIITQVTKCRAAPQSHLFVQACWWGTRVQQALEWFCCSPLHFWFLFCTFLYRKLSGNLSFYLLTLFFLTWVKSFFGIMCLLVGTYQIFNIRVLFICDDVLSFSAFNVRSICNCCAVGVMVCWGCFHICTMLPPLDGSEINNFLQHWIKNQTVLYTSYYTGFLNCI